MSSKVARLLFLSICVVLAVLLLTRTIGTVASALIFAVALVVFGGRAAGMGRRGGSV